MGGGGECRYLSCVHPDFALIKLAKFVFDCVKMVKELISLWKIPPFEYLVNFHTSKSIHQKMYIIHSKYKFCH